MLKRLFLIFLCMNIFISCGKKTKKQGLKLINKPFISSEELEKAELFILPGFKILEKENSNDLYILSLSDRVLAKFKNGKFIKSYKAPEGQGPGDMIFPRTIFFNGKDSICVHDEFKKRILVFDYELNYIKEYKCSSLDIVRIYPIKEGFLAFVRPKLWENSYCVTQFDNNFNIVDEFVPANKKLNWVEWSHYILMNNVHFLDQDTLSHSSLRCYYKNCCIDLYHIKSKEKFLSLKWEQDYTPTKKSIKNYKNNYYNIFIGKKYGKYYVVNNHYTKYLRAPKKKDLLIFDLKGKLVKRDKNYPYRLIWSNSEKVYFIDEDEESIGILDIVNEE